ncbi:hypothetical protein DJ010_05155 [Nocardioides silvaticus]|uniref:Uncharacterized protein n=1 Tax=Nocardioides silvaticus TaxID=2201891 RepID=A0A316TMW2_9ACTN|nr:hypothetical protein [Nocardioides silvaticus]PWN03504.1 hypothetical protein DJ010_05155 [Nocardioides silvaticus]
MADANKAGSVAVELHRQVLQVLLDKIEADRFPSVTMMDMAEELLAPEDVAPYAEVLLDKIRESTYPSLDLLRRVSAFA